MTAVSVGELELSKRRHRYIRQLSNDGGLTARASAWVQRSGGCTGCTETP